MKSSFIVLCVIGVAFAFPSGAEVKSQPEVLKSEFNNFGDKGYNFAVETSDGSKHEETATFKYVGGLSVTGSYEFIDDEGKTHKVKYIADEKGYRPEIID
ncbi:unnamed protein product [Diamesa serratosioi]